MCILKAILYLTFLAAFTNAYFWRDYNGTIPDDAVLGQFGRYIGQINLGNSGILPLTIYPNQREGVGELYGKKVYKNNIKILCGYPDEYFYWRYVDVNWIGNLVSKNNLVIGGFEGSETFYIGRVFHELEWKVSKVFPPGSGNLGLYVWPKNGITVVKFNYFEILYVRQTN